MIYPLPGHVSDVEETVHTSEVYEDAEVGYVLDDPLAHLTFLEFGQELLALALPLLFQYGPPGYDYVPPGLVDLDYLEGEDLTYELVEVPHPLYIYLGAGEEGLDPEEVHHYPPLYAPYEGPLHHLPLLVGLPNLIPDEHEVSPLLGEHRLAVLVLQALHEDRNLVPYLNGFVELLYGDDPLGLEAYVHHHPIPVHPDDPSHHDLTLLDLLEGLLVELGELVLGVTFL